METRKVGEGIAALIPAFSVLGFQIHYVPTGRDERANLKVGIRFAKQTVHKKLYPLMFSSPDFQVPARNGDVRIPSKQTAKHDMDVVAFFPHMHLRGKAMWLDVNEGGKEKRLLEVPAYSFSWQMGYLIRPGTVRIPEGTLMTYHALYNNSDMNTFNPNPNVQPINGERTEDEMLMGFLFYLRPEERLNLNINPATGNVR